MKLLFVCSGNTCRSPLAEAIARRIAEERGLGDITVSSAGASAWPDASASDGSLLVGMERGLDLASHRARPLTAEIVADNDLILGMGMSHVDRALALGGEGKTHLLTSYASGSESDRAVSDPFGGDLETYRATADELESEIGRVFDRIVAERAHRER
jgi:protein-tyrosine-phosphatase